MTLSFAAQVLELALSRGSNILFLSAKVSAELRELLPFELQLEYKTLTASKNIGKSM